MTAVGTGAALAEPAPTEKSAPKGGSSEVETIVVTATKRAENINKVPLSVTAIGAEEIAKKRIVGVEDLARTVPSLTTSVSQGVNRLYIRGIGLNAFASGADSSVAFYVDGVYIGRPAAQLSSYFDTERIEVLRGPQGDLYGRNATGGAVNLITAKPTDHLTGYLRGTGGNYALHQFEGAISGPIISGVLNGRAAFQTINHDGYGKNYFLNHDIDDQNSQAGRGSLDYHPTDWLSALITAEYFGEDDHNFTNAQFGSYPTYTLSGTALGFPVIANQRDIISASGNGHHRRNYAVTSTINAELSDQFRVQSITGVRRFTRYNDSDCAETAANFGDCSYDEKSKTLSQDLTLFYDGQRLTGLFGVSYYHEDLNNHVLVPFPEFGPTGKAPYNPNDKTIKYEELGKLEVDAYAAYGNLTYEILPRLKLTGGARYSVEKRKSTGLFQPPFPVAFGGPIPPVALDAGKEWYGFTPSVKATFQATEDVMLYFTWSKGFKSGTFNIGQNNATPTNPDGAINPEKIEAFEAGVKASAFNNRMMATFAAFLYDYTDLQVNKILGLATATVNAASATSRGLELSVIGKPTDELTLNFSGAYTDAFFEQFTSVNPLSTAAPPLHFAFPPQPQNLQGNPLPGSAKWTINFGAEYRFPFDNGSSVTVGADAQYKSRIYFSEFKDKNISQKGVITADAQIRYEDPSGHWDFSVWGKNIFGDKIAAEKILTIELWGFPVYGAWAPPATYGATLSYKF